ncbi:hypothetical protein GCM10017687_54470 [Streptomyces echinatus]
MRGRDAGREQAARPAGREAGMPGAGRAGRVAECTSGGDADTQAGRGRERDTVREPGTAGIRGGPGVVAGCTTGGDADTRTGHRAGAGQCTDQAREHVTPTPADGPP